MRKIEPNGIYDQFDFDIPIGTNGDSMDRIMVRLEEMVQSVKIIEQALAKLPPGEVKGKVPRVIKPEARGSSVSPH